MPYCCKSPYVEKSAELSEIFATYPYPLSDFQKYAIEGIHAGHHVLTCAPTGSGKTLSAEFAIQFFHKQGKKVIYTSPIKALSNQKYYEFSQKYPHISFGLLTGDIKTNPGADVLIMTTEILMNKLFIENTKNETFDASAFELCIQTELACVIFDEVHYINDADRGHVWEQTIVLLPKHVQMVMLSATIDDPVGFAQWCEQVKTNSQSETNEKKVYLAYTNHREVPLTHYMYWATTEDPFKKIKDKTIQQYIREKSHRFIEIRSPTGKFNDDAYHTISKLGHIFNKERMYMKRGFVLNRLCENLRDAEMLPAIAFVFSRKHVETCAKAITTNLLEFDSKVPYIVRKECDTIIRKFPNYREYLELPEYNQLVSLLEKGVGIHHSGMIPVLRELVELMISRRYVKLLFATESFSIGLDCPIRTAIFTDLRKYDNQGNRELYSHEYTQMAGRAGRRGIDTVGHVVHCNNLFDMPSLVDYKTVLNGQPQKLVSKYHISYSGILTQLRDTTTSTPVNRITVGDIESFVQKSMLASELNERQKSQESILAVLSQEYEKKKAQFESNVVFQEKCKQFVQCKDTLKIDFLSHKKRKEVEKELAAIQQENPAIEFDAALYTEFINDERAYKKEMETYAYTSEYISTQIKHVCKILENQGLITIEEESEDTFLQRTLLGKHASLSAEIPAIIMGELLNQTDFFTDYSEIQLVSLFSIFAQIKVAENKLVRSQPRVRFVQDIIENIIQHESMYQVDTGIHYDELIQVDLYDEMAEWCECTTEQECKYFIQGRLADKGISVGDFTKAVLKISTIAREVMMICECAGRIDTMHRLAQLDGLILKYVTTSQSLYI